MADIEVKTILKDNVNDSEGSRSREINLDEKFPMGKKVTLNLLSTELLEKDGKSYEVEILTKIRITQI